MNKQEFISLMSQKSFGKFKQDRFGHFVREARNHQGEIEVKRLKVQDKTVRVEVQAVIPASEYSPARKMWVRLGSAFYKDIVVLGGNHPRAGSIRIGNYAFKPE